MSRPRIRFIDIVPDMSVFIRLLHACVDTKSTPVALLEPGKDQYTTELSEGFGPLCKAIRGKGYCGKGKCLLSDKQFAKEALKLKRPVVNLCMAGLLDIAVPVIVNDSLVGTILCGQFRSTDPVIETRGIECAKIVADELNIPDALHLRSQHKAPSESEMSELIQDLRALSDVLAGYGEALLATKSFAYNVAHQLQGPLSSIKMSCQIAKTGKLDPKKGLLLLHSMESMSSIALRRVRTLLVSSPGHRIIQSRFIREKTVFRLSSFLINCAIGLQPVAQDRQVMISVDNDSVDAIGEIFAHHDLLLDAVQNIIENAIKYSDENTGVYVDAIASDDELFINIYNIGARLHAKYVQYIFDQYCRTPEAREYSDSGTGIGLHLVKMIAQLHGGRAFARPSIKTLLGWQTVITIALPSSVIISRKDEEVH